MGIGITNAASGGASLNFDVKAYGTEEVLLAAAPKENTIGVITTTAISSWIFSATEPAEPVEGMVWISTGTSSAVEFNALKKNVIQVYPASAKQYVSGAWVDVTAYSYQGGKWVSWLTYLYKAGDECTALTGGWQSRGLKYASNDSSGSVAPTLTRGSDYIKGQLARGSAKSGVVDIVNDVDLSGAKTLYLDCEYNISGDSDSSGAYIFLLVIARDATHMGDATARHVIASGKGTITGPRQTISLDIESVAGLYDVAAGLSLRDAYISCDISIYNCWHK